jgi:Transposase IS116/IS110/IS902 family
MSIILSPASRIAGRPSTRILGRAAEVVRISGKDMVRIYGTGMGKVLGLSILYEIQDIGRFARVQQLPSYGRLVKPTKESGGKILGHSGRRPPQMGVLGGGGVFPAGE